MSWSWVFTWEMFTQWSCQSWCTRYDGGGVIENPWFDRECYSPNHSDIPTHLHNYNAYYSLADRIIWKVSLDKTSAKSSYLSNVLQKLSLEYYFTKLAEITV
jgi:hypothetical protein